MLEIISVQGFGFRNITLLIMLAYRPGHYFHCLGFKWCVHHCTLGFPFPSPWIAYILQSIVETTDGRGSLLSHFYHSLYSPDVFASLLLPCVCLSFSEGPSQVFYHVFSLRQALRDLLQSARSRKPTWADYAESIILYLTIMTLFYLSCHPTLPLFTSSNYCW